MAKLAIKGHPTRGSEVIALLEMLGAINTYKISGDIPCVNYAISSDNEIYISEGARFSTTNFIHFTLEEFEEKFPYKVGDKVRCDGWPCTILNCWWDESVDEIAYCIKGIDFQITTYVKDLRPDQEEKTYKKLSKKAHSL